VRMYYTRFNVNRRIHVAWQVRIEINSRPDVYGFHCTDSELSDLAQSIFVYIVRAEL
jgi:hypothetical protein